MRPESLKRKDGGFTLIEVIAALVVFSAGVLMVLGLTGSLSRQLASAGMRSRVAAVVQNRLDSIQLVPYDSLDVGSTTEIVVLQGRPFNRTQKVLQTTPMVREVEVTVDAADGLGPRISSSAFVIRSW